MSLDFSPLTNRLRRGKTLTLAFASHVGRTEKLTQFQASSLFLALLEGLRREAKEIPQSTVRTDESVGEIVAFDQGHRLQTGRADQLQRVGRTVAEIVEGGVPERMIPTENRCAEEGRKFHQERKRVLLRAEQLGFSRTMSLANVRNEMDEANRPLVEAEIQKLALLFSVSVQYLDLKFGIICFLSPRPCPSHASR